jgi:hypothetical protein
MLAPPKSKLSGLLVRTPVLLLGLAIGVSAAQASCGGEYAADIPDSGADAPVLDGDASRDAARDAPSDDSPEDRADGMSYGDGYGP